MKEQLIGQNIKALREKSGINQEELAAFLNVDRVYISYWENNTRSIPIDKLNLIADFFLVELSDLLEENTNQNKINIATAFRAEGLTAEDLKSIASFKKVVKNYLKMLEIDRKS